MTMNSIGELGELLSLVDMPHENFSLFLIFLQLDANEAILRKLSLWKQQITEPAWTHWHLWETCTWDLSIPQVSLQYAPAGKSIRYFTKMFVQFAGNFLKNEPTVLPSGLKIQPSRTKTQGGGHRGFSCLKQFLPCHPLWPWTCSASLGPSSAFLQPHKSAGSRCRGRALMEGAKKGLG